MEGFEAKCGSRFLFDGPVGLFDDIVEVFALPNFDVCARFIVVSLNRRGVGATLVNVDFHRCAAVADSLPQEAKSCSLVSFRSQQKIDCVALLINSSVIVFPASSHFDVSFVKAPA